MILKILGLRVFDSMSLPFLPLFASVYTLLIPQTCPMASFFFFFPYGFSLSLCLSSAVHLECPLHYLFCQNPTRPEKQLTCHLTHEAFPTAGSKLPEYLHHYSPTPQCILYFGNLLTSLHY